MKKLPKDARCVTDAVLTRGGRIRQGWRAPGKRGPKYYETFHYPGALNFQSIIKVSNPEWR
jgi:hypothetical protein